MIDFHNHILPNVDDGSRSLEMSLKMLKEASMQGITDVVNTVHYQHPKVESKDISFERITKEINNLQLELIKFDIPIKLHSGSEVYFLPNLTDIISDPLVTLGNGKYMLVEFQSFFLPRNYKEEFFKLKMKGVTPILAHPERYKPVQKNIDIIYDFLNMGCLIQVDGGSILGTLGKSAQVASEKIIKNKWCQFIGSDAHDLNKRNFNLKYALDFISEWVDEKYIKSLVFDNPQKVLDGKSIFIEFDEYKTISNRGIINKIFNFVKSK